MGTKYKESEFWCNKLATPNDSIPHSECADCSFQECHRNKKKTEEL